MSPERRNAGRVRRGLLPDPERQRSYLYDLSPEQAERHALVRAGLPIPAHLEARKNLGNKEYPQLLTPPLRLDRHADLRKVHREDSELPGLTRCKAFWGIRNLRHTPNWSEVTCRKCLCYRLPPTSLTVEAAPKDGPK